METASLSLLCLFAFAAAWTDMRSRKVPNRLVLAGAACGTAVAACRGWQGLAAGLGGMLLGLLLLLPAFMLRLAGGGDVKCLAVIGLFTGPQLLWVSFLRGAVAGGLVAMVLLAARRLSHLRRRDGKEASGRVILAASWTLPYAGILSLTAALSAVLSQAGYL